MKRNIILLVDADADLAQALFEVTGETGHGIRLARTSTQAFQVLNSDLEHVDVVVIDVDREPDGTMLRTIEVCCQRTPVIAITASEEASTFPILKRLGTAACFAKPVSIDRLRSSVKQVRQLLGQGKILFCDVWGHLHEEPAPGSRGSWAVDKTANAK